MSDMYITPGIIKRLKKMFSRYIEDEDEASEDIPANKIIIRKNQLKKTKTAITEGDTLSSTNLEDVADGLNLVNDKFNLSSTEEIVGYFGDDPIYKKVICEDGLNISAAETRVIDESITGTSVKWLFSITGGLKFTSSGSTYYRPFGYISDPYFDITPQGVKAHLLSGTTAYTVTIIYSKA